MSYFNKITAQFDASNLSPFGDLNNAELTPIFQIDGVYGILTQSLSTTTSGTGATVDTSSSRFRLQSGTTATTGNAVLQSAYPIRYRAGQGIVARFTGAWVTSAANSTQIIGMGNATDGYFFGFTGTSFGILHRNGGSDTWVAQSSWNGDKADGTGSSGFNWNKTYGNVMMIKYPYLGYGDIQFFVQDSVTGRFILVHTIRYANTSASVQISNPSLNFYSQSANTGANTTNLTVYIGSVGVFIAGKREFTTSQFGIDYRKTGITTETCIINLKNATTFNGVSNKGLIRLRSIGISGDGANGQGVFRFKKGVAIGGAPVYICISGTTADNGTTITSGQSFASYDVAGTTVTGGTLIYNVPVSRQTAFEIDVTNYNIFVNPSEILTCSFFGYVSIDALLTLNWNEDI